MPVALVTVKPTSPAQDLRIQAGMPDIPVMNIAYVKGASDD
jgi:hypothetical protein